MSTGRPSNVAVLTHENKIWSAKKRQKKEQVKEVVFDEDARREFLTGFRKRKLARHEAGKAKAIERDRISRLEARREKRKQLAERAVENARAVEQAYAGDIDLEDFDPSTSTQQTVPQEMEFEDEEQLATVTVVEDFDTVDLKMLSSGYDAAKEENVPGTPSAAKKPLQPLLKPPKAAGRSAPAKSKFRRGSKATSKHEKIKQRGRREEKAKRKNGRR